MQAFGYAGSGVRATVVPEQCVNEQTSAVVTSAGQKYTMTPYYTCGKRDTRYLDFKNSNGFANINVFIRVLFK